MHNCDNVGIESSQSCFKSFLSFFLDFDIFGRFEQAGHRIVYSGETSNRLEHFWQIRMYLSRSFPGFDRFECFDLEFALIPESESDSD
jgi:hypothetical protein